MAELCDDFRWCAQCLLAASWETPMTFEHIPVMVEEILSIFDDVPDGVVLDATLGGAGHAVALLERRPELSVVGLDQDDEALAAARKRLEPFGERAQAQKCRFDQLGSQLDALGHDEISGFLFDLGVSSHQIDTGERGFSYRNDGPLDMRMDQSAGRTAADVVNTVDERELADILRSYGDEKHAMRIAKAIIAARPVTTTTQLADIVREATPARDKRRGDPSKRTFQALRIEVNQELSILEGALESALDRLCVGGRGAVLAYHSGEDRIVKAVFRDRVDVDDHRSPVPLNNEEFSLLWNGSKKPRDDENSSNRRATSARLRGIERVAVAA